MQTLDDICTLITDGSHYSPEDEGVGYPMLSVKDMLDDRFDLTSCKRIGEEVFRKLVANGCKPQLNDVVVAKDGSYLKTAFSIKEEQDVVLLSSIAILRPNLNLVLPDYLSFFLKSKSAYRTVSLNYITGTALKRIILKGIKKISVDFPSIAKQQYRIDLLNYTYQIIRQRQQQLQKLDALVKARFVEMFGDLKTNNKGWKIVCFKECANIDTNMIHNFKGYENYPHIGIDSIERDTGRLFGFRTISEDGVISGKYLFTPNHIIYSKIRPNLNKVALPNFEGLCSADAYPILVKSGICNREYLAYTLRSQCFLDYILTFSSRTNLPKVNKNQVEGFYLPLPPIEIQNQFVKIVNQVEKTKTAIQTSLNKTQELYDALMQEYFG